MLDAPNAAASLLHGRLVFLLATRETQAERLLTALGSLPGVVVAPVPTHLFSEGIDELLDHWRTGLAPNQGLEVFAGEQRVLLAVRRLADAVLGAIPGSATATRIVEYSPDHITGTKTIASLRSLRISPSAK